MILKRARAGSLDDPATPKTLRVVRPTTKHPPPPLPPKRHHHHHERKTFYAPTPRRQVEVALDFARGMAYLHSRRQPIVHRDLKVCLGVLCVCVWLRGVDVCVQREREGACERTSQKTHAPPHTTPSLHTRARAPQPANLMISGNLNADAEQLFLDSGVIKVADFGLSKSLVPVERHGAMTTVALSQVYKLTGETGSYRYMAPEVFRCE